MTCRSFVAGSSRQEDPLIGGETVVVLGWRALIITTGAICTAGTDQNLEAPVGATLWA